MKQKYIYDSTKECNNCGMCIYADDYALYECDICKKPILGEGYTDIKGRVLCEECKEKYGE